MTMNSPSRRWWLAMNGQVDGPRTETYVLAGLQSGQLQPTTQACPEGGNEWRALASWPEWHSHISAGSSRRPPPFPTPPPPPASSGFGFVAPGGGPNAYDRLVTNPALPPMANAICIFTIVLLPLYWLFGVVSTLVSPGTTPDEFGFSMMSLIFGSPIALAITILLAVGGLRLRTLRASGVRLIKIGLIIDFVFVALSLILGIVVLVAVAASGQAQESAPDGVGTFFSVIGAVAGLSALVFEIVAFVWLMRCSSSLPLNSGT